MIADAELLILNAQGIIPGPEETEPAFIKRATKSLSLSRDFNVLREATVGIVLPFTGDDSVPLEDKQEALHIVRQQFGCSPDWVPAFYNSDGLAFFHGAKVWTAYSENDEYLMSFLQLRRQFRNSSRYLKIYHRDEFLAHEFAHIGRIAFKESNYEEYFAFQTSRGRLRKFFGPLVRSYGESVFFLFVVALSFLIELVVISTASYEHVFQWSLPILSLPWFLATFACLRLVKQHYKLKKLRKKLALCLPNSKDANAVLFRLSDEEIDMFSKITPEKIVDYSTKQNSLRWRVLLQGYFLQSS